MTNIGILDYEGKNNNPLNNKPYSDTYKKLGKTWSKFPAYENVKDTLNIIKNNQVVLITSGTGSGKTVLIPKYVLHNFDYTGHILVSLPKQIIAQSAAEYAAVTLDVELGDQVGYKYKGSDAKYVGKNPNLLYATDGTIVAKLLNDPLLSEYNAVVIDEAHERKVQIDFMLYLLRNVVEKRPDFKLIIMSATVNSEVFASYFAQYKFEQLDIGSKTNYDIKSIFVDKTIGPSSYINYGIDIIKNLLKQKESGKISDILFFVTSVTETLDVAKQLRALYPDKECIEIYSGISQDTQDKISKKTTENQRILIATNVAESSLTVDGIKYVIDSGYELLSYYDPIKRARVLDKGLITQAQAKQRMGRAGRTAPGICYHLYSKDDFNNNMKKYPEPSIRVSNITTETLRLLSLDTIQTVDKVLSVLGALIEPPRENYIKLALKTMFDLNLISDNKINDLGMFCSSIQLESEQALAIYCAYRLHCSKEVIAILLISDLIKNNINELFMLPNKILKISDNNIDADKQNKLNLLNIKFKETKKKLAHKYGDHLTILNIFSKYRKIEGEDKRKQWCHEHFLKYNILKKCEDTYDRIKYRLIGETRKFSDSEQANNFKIIDDSNLVDLNSLNIDYKILYALKFGYKYNLGFYNDNNKSYRTLYSEDRVNIAKDSVLWNADKNIFYSELFISGGNSNLNIVSVIPKKIQF
jgi:pre-mRNA-splicing factor ATP-dependent RNA helicase DHX15/PRP43